MKPPDDMMRENEALRERLSRLSRASLRINESLDFDAVLQEMVDGARALTASSQSFSMIHRRILLSLCPASPVKSELPL